MSRLQELRKTSEQIGILEELTGAFESIASSRIRQIREQTIASTAFFANVWHLYTQLRKEPEDQFVYERHNLKAKEAILIITSRGRLTGEIDHRIVQTVVQEIDPNAVDIITIGIHGKTLLEEEGIKPVQVFDIAEEEDYLPYVDAIIHFLEQYPNTTAYYETYVSLAVQEVKKIQLLFAVKALGEEEASKQSSEEIISRHEYIFEPSFEEVIGHMESIMLRIALTQILMESTLAQYASRFTAMHRAHDQSHHLHEETDLVYRKTKRAIKDAQLKEILYPALFLPS